MGYRLDISGVRCEGQFIILIFILFVLSYFVTIYPPGASLQKGLKSEILPGLSVGWYLLFWCFPAAFRKKIISYPWTGIKLLQNWTWSISEVRNPTFGWHRSSLQFKRNLHHQKRQMHPSDSSKLRLINHYSKLAIRWQVKRAIVVATGCLVYILNTETGTTERVAF